MPAVIAITNLTPYRGNYQSFQSLLATKPNEGPRATPISFLWSADAIAPNYAVNVNFAASPIKPITQIASLYVDNLSNDADVSFYFPDTSFRLDVPADTVGLFPVITNGLQFIAYCPQASDGDMTFVQVLNFNPPPISVVKTQFQTPVQLSLSALPTSAGTVYHNVYVGAGTLRALNIVLTNVTASAIDLLTISIEDSASAVAGPILYQTTETIGIAAAGYNVVSLSGLNIPFSSGLELALNDVNGHITSGFITVNAYVSVK